MSQSPASAGLQDLSGTGRPGFGTYNKTGKSDISSLSLDLQPGDAGILSYHLQSGIAGAVTVLGGRNVRVGFAGDQAFHDYQLGYVNLPAIPPSIMLPIPYARGIRGFGAHEKAHIIWTDEDFMQHGIPVHEQEDRLLFTTWNCIEDYMIERNDLDLFPGNHKNYTATEERCCASYLEAWREDPDMARDLRRVGPVALTWARSIFFNLPTSASRDCLKTLSAENQRRVWDWFDSIIGVESTKDCWDRAREIVADIRAKPFDPADPPQNPQNGQSSNGQIPQGPGQGQPGQGAPGQGSPGQSSSTQTAGGQGNGGPNSNVQNNAAGAQCDTSSPDGTGPGQTPNGQSGKKKTKKPASGQQDGIQASCMSQKMADDAAAKAAQNGQGGTANEPAPFLPQSALSQIYKDLGLKGDASWTKTWGITSDHRSGPASEALADDTGLDTYRQARAELSSTTSAVAAIIQRSLRAITKSRWRGGREDGRIDQARLASALTGSSEIYRMIRRGEKIDTAVQVVIDCSGSMVRKMLICQQLGIVLQQAFAGTPIALEILGYTSGEMDDLPDEAKVMADAIQQHLSQNGQANKIENLHALNLYVFKDFEASHAVAMKTLGNMQSVPNGNTPTGDALLFAQERLARRPEARKVMLVLTDGQPNAGQTPCGEAVAVVENSKIQALAIGIGCDSVKDHFKDYVVLNDINELPALVLGKLSQLLFSKKHLVSKARQLKHQQLEHARMPAPDLV